MRPTTDDSTDGNLTIDPGTGPLPVEGSIEGLGVNLQVKKDGTISADPRAGYRRPPAAAAAISGRTVTSIRHSGLSGVASRPSVIARGDAGCRIKPA